MAADSVGPVEDRPLPPLPCCVLGSEPRGWLPLGQGPLHASCVWPVGGAGRRLEAQRKEKVGASVLPAPPAQLLLPPSDLQAQGHSGGLPFLVSGSPLRSLNPAHISFI